MAMDVVEVFCERWGASEVLMRSLENPHSDLRFSITGGEGRSVAAYQGEVEALRIGYQGRFGNYFLQLVNLFHVAEILGVSKVYIYGTSEIVLDSPRNLDGIVAYPLSYETNPEEYCLEGVFFQPDALGPVMDSLTPERRRALIIKYLHPLMGHLIVYDEIVHPDDLVIHLRSGDIFNGIPPAVTGSHLYVQPPLAFYLKVIADVARSTLRTIHLISQTGNNPVLAPLVKKINELKLPVSVRINQDFHSDLRMMLSARRIVLANGTLGVGILLASNAAEDAFLFRNDGSGTLIPVVDYVGQRIRTRCYFETGPGYVSSWGWRNSPDQIEAMLSLGSEDVVAADGGFGDQEAYISLYREARRRANFGYPVADVIETFLRAADADLARAEPLHAASLLCRENGLFAQGCEIGRRAIDLVAPANALFVEPWIYEYGSLDEFAVNAYWAGLYDDCLDACLRILERGTTPLEYRSRVRANAGAAQAGLRKSREEQAHSNTAVMAQRLGGACRGIIHIGANTGQEVPIYERYNVEWLVLVEPLKEQFDRLSRNVAHNGRFVPVNAICTSVKGEDIEFHVASNDGQSSSILTPARHVLEHPSVTFGETIQLTSTTVDDVLSSVAERYADFEPTHVDGLAIDVQGAELEVLRGATRTLTHIKYLTCEVSYGGLYEGDASISLIQEFLNQYGFAINWLDINKHGWGDAFFVRT
jgi:FkbM family methyltransferase